MLLHPSRRWHKVVWLQPKARSSHTNWLNSWSNVVKSVSTNSNSYSIRKLDGTEVLLNLLIIWFSHDNRPNPSPTSASLMFFLSNEALTPCTTWDLDSACHLLLVPQWGVAQYSPAQPLLRRKHSGRQKSQISRKAGCNLLSEQKETYSLYTDVLPASRSSGSKAWLSSLRRITKPLARRVLWENSTLTPLGDNLIRHNITLLANALEKRTISKQRIKVSH